MASPEPPGTPHTLNPVALPVPIPVAPTVTEITVVNVGTAQYPESTGHGFALLITFDQTMNWGMNPYPTVTLASADNQAGLSSVLTYNQSQSWWDNDHRFRAAFDVALPEEEVVVANVDVYITGAYNVSGDLEAPYVRPHVFSIDITPT